MFAGVAEKALGAGMEEEDKGWLWGQGEVALVILGLCSLALLCLLSLADVKKNPRTATGDKLKVGAVRGALGKRWVRRGVVLLLLLTGMSTGPGYRGVVGTRPRKGIDRGQPLGHDVERKYEADCQEGLKRFDEFVRGAGWSGV